MAFPAHLDDWLQSFTQNTNASITGQTSSEAELASFLTPNAPLTKLERLLLEEDALFQQLQDKRGEIRRERAQKQNDRKIEPMQSRAAGVS